MQEAVASQVSHIPHPFRLTVERCVLHFRVPARTSRGSLQERVLYRIKASTQQGAGYGECCTMPGLSLDEDKEESYIGKLREACRIVEQQRGLLPGQLEKSPSLRFGLECALLAALRPGLPRWDTPFTRGEEALQLHHLIWMDSPDAMFGNMERGMEKGFRCLKMKVGALPFGLELSLLHHARKSFPHAEIRVDANGAFLPEEALDKLEKLAHAGVSSIEQPIHPGQYNAMAALCHQSPLPIALDEELIAATSTDERRRLLDTIHPHALVLKPSLHGGLSGAEEWAKLAAERHIRWWANSALESHIGLAALAEWCSLRAPSTLHGLGTGLLFKDDTPGPVRLSGHTLIYTPSGEG